MNDKKIAIDVTDIVKNNKIRSLKKKYGIGRWLSYNMNPEFGIIGGWLLDSKRGVPDALKVIFQHRLTVYIHRNNGSAIIGWNARYEYWCGQNWKMQKLVDSFTTKEKSDILKYLNRWWESCK